MKDLHMGLNDASCRSGPGLVLVHLGGGIHVVGGEYWVWRIAWYDANNIYVFVYCEQTNTTYINPSNSLASPFVVYLLVY
jgi:hypothetical protein